MIKFVIVSLRWWLPTLSSPTWSLFLVGDGRLHAQDHRCHLWGRSSGFEIVHLFISSFWITLKIRPPLHLHTFVQHMKLCPICICVWVALCSFTFILFFFFQLQRLMEQRHLSERDSKLMIGAQMNMDKKVLSLFFVSSGPRWILLFSTSGQKL